MPFPRYSRGSNGSVSFTTMNEIFDRIEALDGLPAASKGKGRPKPGPFLARLLVPKPNVLNTWSFVEVTHETSLGMLAYPSVEGGRVSSDGTDSWAYPAVGSGLIAGQIVMLFPMNRDSSTAGIGSGIANPLNGTLVFHVMTAPSQDIVARVAGAVASGTQRWKYTMQMCDAVLQSGAITWVVPNGEPVFNAWNGAEAVTDSAGSYGVGSSPPAATTITRQPIKTGVVVNCTKDRNGNWTFICPNGYAVTC